MILVATLAAGAFGALVRYMVDGFVQDRVADVFPWGTWVVNISGSFVLGFVTGLVLFHDLGNGPKAVIGVGFVGAYTTFSTFSYETVRLAEEGARYEAMLNAAANTVIAMALSAAGLALASVA